LTCLDSVCCSLTNARVLKFKVKRSRSSGRGRLFKVKRSIAKVKVVKSRSKGQSHVSGIGYEY
jgi:hypothetical protein